MRATIFMRGLALAAIVGLCTGSSVFADKKDNKDNGGGNSGRSSNNNNNSNSNSGRSFSSRSSSDNGRSNSRTFRKDSDDDNKSNQSDKIFQFKPGQNGPLFKQGSKDYQVRRPTDDNNRDFLKLPNNDNARRFKDRSPQERALVDKQYQQWQKVWNGNKNDGKDHRDWSGSWKNSDRFTNADRIRNDWRGRKQNDLIFGGNWWNGKHSGNYWNFWGDYSRRYNRPWYWWSWANGPRLGTWVTFGWPTPYYWDYGPGEYIAYNNGGIYVNGRYYQTAPDFYTQTLRIADSGPRLSAEEAARLDWMPLGVFSVTLDGVAEPQVTVQLAVTRDGIVGGTAFDQRGGAAFGIQGMVDKRTQRAVWAYVNDRGQRVLMETSLYNLTQPEATGMVYYGPSDMRVVELVRLQDPSGGSGPQGDPGALPPPVAQ